MSVDGEGGWYSPSSDESEESFEAAAIPRWKSSHVDAKTSPHVPSFIDTNRNSPEHALAQSAQIVLGRGGQPLKGHEGVWRDVSSRLHLNLQLGGATKSAPTTVFSSPALSPRRLSSGEFSPSRNFKTTQGRDLGISLSVPSLGQNLMAEKNTIMQSLSGKVLTSPDRSPLQSPRMRSPCTRSRIHSGAVLPLHPSFSTGPHDDGTNVTVHRLPLPPGNAGSVGAAPSPNSPSVAVQCSSLRTETLITPGQWQKGKLLGSGTFGTVYVGFNRETGDMCAMKEVPLIADDSKSLESIKQLEQEINLLSQLKHPNIVQYYGCKTLEDAFYIYLEYVPGGSIFKILRKYGPLPEPVIRIYTHQILSGLAYLHNQNTVHRDIKGANLLADTSGKIKLADFGMAKHEKTPSPFSCKGPRSTRYTSEMGETHTLGHVCRRIQAHALCRKDDGLRPIGCGYVSDDGSTWSKAANQPYTGRHVTSASAWLQIIWVEANKAAHGKRVWMLGMHDSSAPTRHSKGIQTEYKNVLLPTDKSEVFHEFYKYPPWVPHLVTSCRGQG